MIDLIERCYFLFDKLRPGLAKQCKEHAVLTRAFGGYRTPSNHHLRRALRLSWVRAASTIVDHWGGWARSYPDQAGATQILDFIPAFDAARQDVIRLACNQDSGQDIEESPIDAFLDAVLEDLGKHLKDGTSGTGREAIRKSLGPTFMKLTGRKLEDIPSRILHDASEGFSAHGGERRDFGQLLFDEFARVVQTPDFYPEAAESAKFALAEIHRRANEDLHQSLQSQLALMASTLPGEIQSEIQHALSGLTATQLRDSLQENHHELMTGIGEIKTGIDELRARSSVVQEGALHIASTIEHHTPVQSRTVTFSGFRNSAETALNMDGIADILSRKTSRLGEDDAILPLIWDFAESTRREEPDGNYARTEAWTTLNDNVIGCVLVLSETMGRDIDPDDRFLLAIDDRKWLEPAGPIHDLANARNKERLDALRQKAVPITYETRFALEAILRGKPLIVFVPRQRGEQSLAVENFLNLLGELQIPCIQQDPHTGGIVGLDAFTDILMIDDREVFENPYRGLDYYQVEDVESYHGRKPEAAQALAHIQEAIDDKRGIFLGITGPSGGGKSSFLRARVAADVRSSLDLTPLEIRPTDFQVPGDAKISTLPHLCEEIAARLGETPPQELVGENAVFHKLHLTKFKTWIDEKLATSNCPKIMICLDQFEEILDDLSEGVHEGEWHALLKMLNHLVGKHKWPVVFTLEDSRSERFKRLAPELGLTEAKLIGLQDHDSDFYRTVIRKPFENINIDLDNDIVDTLLKEIERYQNDVGASSSPLPLLSLRLESLFREVAHKAPKSSSKSNLSRNFDRILISRDHLRNKSLALGAMVADLAETAWTLGGGRDELADIGFFLRPLIRVSIDRDNPEDAKLVIQTVAGRGMPDERRLESAFKRRRVLVPSGGGLRLVHESVIRHWPQAREWFEQARDQLLKESSFRADAIRWADENRPNVPSANDTQVNIAARLLHAHIREWSMSDLPPMDAETRALRDFALAVFMTSTNARTIVHEDKPDISHVHIAAAYGLNKLLEDFIANDPEIVHLKSHAKQRTPLGNASWGHPSTVKLLLANDALADELEGDGFCPLDSAIWGEQDEIVDILLNHVDPKTWNDQRANPLCGAASLGRLDLAEKLTARGFRHDQPTKSGWTPLHSAATRDDLKNFKYFLDRGNLKSLWQADDPLTELPNTTNEEPTSAPKQRVNVSATPFHIAASSGHVNIIQFLLSREDAFDILETPTASGETPLNRAAKYHKYQTVSMLLSVMTDPNAKTNTGWGPGYNALHHALADFDAQRVTAPGHIKRLTQETALALLKCDTLDVLAETDNGKTPWQMAVGLPDVQRKIELHPKFSVEAQENIRKQGRARNLGVRQEELFDAVINENHDVFDALLHNFEPSETIDGSKFLSGKNTRLGEILLDKNWVEQLTTLIKIGRINPWHENDGYAELLIQAHQKEENGVIAEIQQRMPAIIPDSILHALLFNLRGHKPDIHDQNGNLEMELLKRTNKNGKDNLLPFAARRGDVEFYKSLIAEGADPKKRDAWGRIPIETGSIELQKTMGNSSERSPTKPDLFAHDASEMRPLKDKSLNKKLDPGLKHIKWDASVRFSARPLAFYPGARLIVAKHNDWQPNLFLYWLERDDEFYRLDGTSPPIHEFNSKNPLDFSEGKADDYLRFFCFFVRGDEGPFFIIDDLNSAYLPSCLKHNEDEDDLVERFAKVYRSPRAFGVTDDKKYRISALIYYSNALFVSDFLVHSTGMIEMKEDWPVIADLPMRIVAPLG